MATGCQLLEAETSVRRRFRAALRQALRLTVRGRYTEFISLSPVTNSLSAHSLPKWIARARSAFPHIAIPCTLADF
jgi:hypothetical protein